MKEQSAAIVIGNTNEDVIIVFCFFAISKEWSQSKLFASSVSDKDLPKPLLHGNGE